MGRLDELRLMAKVAALYHEDKVRQHDIARRLGLSQSAVSRLLQRAAREGIVRVSVQAPPGTHPALERALAARYGLDEAIVVDDRPDAAPGVASREAEAQLMRDLGAAGAFHVESTLRPDEVVGISAYGSAAGLLETLTPRPVPAGLRVVQLSGGVGNPAAEEHQAQVARRLATRLGGEAVLLPAPAVAASPAARRALLADPFVQAAHALFDAVTLALLGIGTTHPPFSPPRGYMGSFTLQERALLEERGAAGFVCHRFFDAAGCPVATPLDQRVIAATGAQLRRVPRRVGICGGPSRWVPLRGALRGRWLTVLITDRASAEHLLTDEPAPRRELEAVGF